MYIKSIFKFFVKEPEYLYFKRIVNKYYGMCGTKREYTKIKKETGSYSQLWNMRNIQKMSVKDWEIIGKEEFYS